MLYDAFLDGCTLAGQEMSAAIAKSLAAVSDPESSLIQIFGSLTR